MRTSPARLAACLLFVSAVAAPGCGNSEQATFTCDPACPPGTRCTGDGCVPESVGATPDLAVSGDLSVTCATPCSGATPYCSAGGFCVPCVEDKHCPVGSWCRMVGVTSTCVPGCNDDTRCGGGTKCCANQCIDVSKDARNCGACGMSCMTPNAGAACVNGQCTAGMCRAGWGDCNNNAADGCETSLRTDGMNCSACGMTCSIPHAVAACADGCYLAACNYGYEDCNSDAKDGCEVATLADIKNCGDCGVVCAGVSRAQVGCNLGACVVAACFNGYSDCDGVYNNGCEVATGTDARNCGQCGKQCAQGQVCINGECTCPPCNFPNAKAGCFGNMCGIASCNAGWANCDNNTQNGCEQNLDSDANNCGACGVKCPQGLVCVQQSCTCPQCKIPNARSVCINNVCVLDSCLPGYGNCDGQQGNGCEVDLSADANNCAACGKVCGANMSCSNGVCSVCAPGSITFNATGVVDTFMVRAGCGKLTIEAWGAQGGGANGGKGARMRGDFVVVPGEVLSIAVGKQGVVNNCGGANASGGGGGGTFVWRAGQAALPMIAAGGGGGGNQNFNQGPANCWLGLDGVDTPDGTNGNDASSAAGGKNGNGGAGNAPSGTGSGGTGWLTAGQDSTYGGGCTGGKPPPNFTGGNGNMNFGPGGQGGFGGGGGAVCGCGGGGGYSGGGAGEGSMCRAGGGGGGSFNAGANQSNTPGVQLGDGQVKLSWS